MRMQYAAYDMQNLVQELWSMSLEIHQERHKSLDGAQ